MNQGHVAFGDVINLNELRSDLDVQSTHALIKSEDMEVIRMSLSEGKKLPEHSVEGQITVQCLKGKMEFKANGITHTLGKNDWLALERNTTHAVEVQEDAVFLLTVLFTGPSK